MATQFILPGTPKKVPGFLTLFNKYVILYKMHNTIRLDLTPSFCNNWPELAIEANNRLIWHGHVAEKTSLNLMFDSEDINYVTIKYLNKRNGPDIWDTKMNDHGQIIEDQNCVLTDIYINRARCGEWLIPTICWKYDDGRTVNNYGFMDLKGSMSIEFPRDVYSWIIQQRQLLSTPTSEKTSSISYKNIYIPQHENQLCLQLIDEIKQKIETLNG